MKLDTLQLQIAVPTASAPLVHTGDAIPYRVDAFPNEVFTSRIYSVGTQVDPATSTVTVLASIPNPAGRLRDNISARVWVVWKIRSILNTDSD